MRFVIRLDRIFLDVERSNETQILAHDSIAVLATFAWGRMRRRCVTIIMLRLCSLEESAGDWAVMSELIDGGFGGLMPAERGLEGR